MAMLDEIEAQLSATGIVGGSTGWGCYKGYMPATPDKAIVVVDTAGVDVDISDGTKYDEVTFQLLGRGAEYGYEALQAKMQAAAFTALHDQDVSGYVFIFATTPGPIPLGLDENNRPRMSWNFRAMRQRT